MAASSKTTRPLYVVRWMVAGALLGAFFTLTTWRLVVGDAGSVAYAELHAAYPTLWMVDLAPSVLGISGAVIGVLFTRLAESKERIEFSWIPSALATLEQRRFVPSPAASNGRYFSGREIASTVL